MSNKVNLMVSTTLELDLLSDQLEWLHQILKGLTEIVLFIQVRESKL